MLTMSAMPKRKPAYPCLKIEDHVYVSGIGITNKYEDPDGSVSRLLELLDGTKTVSEIAAILSHEFGNIDETMVLEAVVDLDQDGFIEDTLHIGSEILNEYQLQRYHRNINFFSTYASQEQNKYELQKKLADAKVCIIGLGGIGSHIVLDLAGLGVGHLRAVEFDKVELSNLNRQILYSDAQLGMSKAQSARQRVKEFNAQIDFEVVEKQITSTEDALEVISGYQFVILVADRPKTLIARWVNEACVRLGVTLLAVGLEVNRAMHYTVIPGETGCIECWLDHVKNTDALSFAILEERRRLNLPGDNMAVVPLVSAITGMVGAELMRLITGIAPSVTAGKLMTIQFDTMMTSIAEEWPRNPDCHLCKNSN